MKVSFPFKNKRKNQDEMISAVETCINERKNLLIHAPTGIGKTVAALYPAVKIAVEKGLNVFFLTPRHSQHLIAMKTLKMLGGVRAADIIGKKWLCNVGLEDMDSREFQEACSYLKRSERCRFFNNTWEGDTLSEGAKRKIAKLSKGIYLSDEVKEECKDFCPYEILCQLGRRSTVIVCDYYHIFGPNVWKAFLKKVGKDLSDSILIVDEAHQLPSRIRSALSVKLTDFTLRNAYKEAKNFGSSAAYAIENIRLGVERLAKSLLESGEEALVEKEHLTELFNSHEELVKELEAIADSVREGGKERSFCSSLSNFISSWMESGEDFARVIKRRGIHKSGFELRLISLMPSTVSERIINGAYSTILMSATLQPLEMYADILGVKNYTTCSFMPIFPKENRLNVISPIATTRYSKRGEEQYKRYAHTISRIFSSVKGNAVAFFPSYEFLDNVRSFLPNNMKIFVERRKMSKGQKENMLNLFVNSKKALLLGVQGGSFYEGIDFPNNSLKCIIIAGIALAKPDLETKSLIECYEKHYGKGMEYAYIYPAIQKAIQAAGRAIRSERDRASIVYLDERFLWRNYRSVLAGENFTVSKEPWKEIEKFESGGDYQKI